MPATPNHKCLIVTDTKDSVVVLIDFNKKTGYSCRLPFYSEISGGVIEKSKKENESEKLILLNTHQEIDPWELFVGFPVSDDYGYLKLANKTGNFTTFSPDNQNANATYQYWDIMIEEDKQLIQKLSPITPVFLPPVRQ